MPKDVEVEGIMPESEPVNAIPQDAPAESAEMMAMEGEAPAEPMPLPLEGEAPAEPVPLPLEGEAPAEPMPLPLEGEAPAEPVPLSLPLEGEAPAEPVPEQERQMQEQMAQEQAMMEAMADAERLRPLPCLYDPAILPPHSYADLLPGMRLKQFEELRESIELDGLQNPIVLFQDMILDGRNRCAACRDLGRMVLAFEFIGTEQEALQYVLSSNQHRRDLTSSQRAAVAVDILPQISEDVNQKRIEKIREARLSAAGNQTMENSPESESAEDSPITARALAGDMMGVNDSYVGLAKRLKDASPELFERVRAGDLSLSAALDELTGTPDDPHVIRIKSVRQKLNKLLRSPELAPALLDRMEALVAEFANL